MIDSLVAWKFYKNSDSGSSRKLFRFSLVHLPVLMILFLVNKKRWIFNEERNAVAVGLVTSAETANSGISEANNELALSVDPIQAARIAELERKAAESLENMLR